MRPEDRLPMRRLTVAYVAALSLIALLSGAVHLLLDHVITQQRDSGTIINVAGRQRMLSQRIGLLAGDYYQGRDERAAAPLLQAAAAMERAQHALLSGDGALGIGHGLSDAARALYFSPPVDLDRRTRDLVLSVRLLTGAAGPVADPAASDAATADVRRQAFTDIQRQTRDEILPLLDQAVSLFEAEGAARIEWLRHAQQGVLAILLTTLLAEAMFIFRPLVGRLRAYTRRLYDLATRDALTGLPNRHHFLEMGGRTLSLVQDARQPLALMMVDVDHFKAINDTFGHEAGDHVLRRFGQLIQGWLAASAVAGRIGGEEFAILLPDTDALDAVAAGESLRQVVEAACGDGPAWTISIGIATLAPEDFELADVMRRADLALYAAKSAGRNQVRLSPDR
ncbi:MAG: diguanylate cyclase [Azospirillaceae bacterium]|nr:diguanylate cyclase [Azospirillaceae bacterium]